MNTRNSGLPRREFLRQSVCAGFGLTGMLSSMGTLRLFNAALSTAAVPSDYKALICVFLFGGNDANNMFVPYDQTNYDAYASARGVLGLTKGTVGDPGVILPIPLTGQGSREYALHPNMGALQSLAQSSAKPLAVVANVGTLVAPITKAEYRSGGAALPPYLFSHNDQQVQWQTSVPDSPKKIGWGGRLADLTNSLNQGSQISMNISVAGNNFFQVGNEVYQYQVTSNGSISLKNTTGAPYLNKLIDPQQTAYQSYSHLFESEYAGVTKRAIDNDILVKSVLAATPLYSELFPRSTIGTDTNGKAILTRLAGQLRLILRMIVNGDALSMHRQTFFASMGGFDTHDNELIDHGNLMLELSNALADFYDATVALGCADKATVFTASDFNRTFSTNGKGADHAWGSHQLVLGGAVNGGTLYGQMPILQAYGPDDTGSRGSWIPTTSVDEYSATLAKWFGVADGDMPLVLPNIGRFKNKDLGFMKPA